MDVLIACPIFVDGELFAWVANAGHQYDLGGIVPGGWPQNAPDVYSDPVVLPPFKLVEKGVMRKDLEAVYLRQSRVPDLVALDLRGQVAGVNFAKEEIKKLCDQYGAKIVKSVMKKVLDQAQKEFQEKLNRVPDGKWTEVRYLDEPMPGLRSTQKTQLNITKKGDRLFIDNEGTDLQTEGTNGLPYTSWAGVIMGIFSVTMLYDRLFAIGGGERQIDYAPQPGLLTCVDYPAAVSGGIMQTNALANAAQVLISRMLATDPELKKDMLAGSTEFLLPVLTGENDRGEYFGQGLLDAFGGGSGARSYKDGINTSGPVWSPLSMLLNVEMVEQWYPIVYLYRREDCDSAGAGMYRGGVGVRSAITPYRAKNMQVITITSGQAVTTHGGPGLDGGYPSPASHYAIAKGTDLEAMMGNKLLPKTIDDLQASETFRLRSKSNGTPLNSGDVLELRVVGGGGYGDPIRRDPESVAMDIRLGYVSENVGRIIYGVVLDDGGNVDIAETNNHRKIITNDRSKWRMPDSTNPANDSVNLEADTLRSVGEYLGVATLGGKSVFACASCGKVHCRTNENYKMHLLMNASPINSIPTNISPEVFLDEKMEFRRFACPSCLVLVKTEVVRSSDEIFADIVLTA
ncbi:MAG: hydantoinase B/oxoprolinase family protein [Desulforhabdus sp.]|jgi:N-methylhydantoinase B|nr:hydantoinase B/oxoprolinase family protein [Desulforhabdus sp.]